MPKYDLFKYENSIYRVLEIQEEKVGKVFPVIIDRIEGDWYVGRTDDVIKSSGYRIGPFEIESVIMELPYVLECAVTAAPDPIRGQVVKASIVLTKGTEGTEALKKEIQTYVKTNTAPYKYPRIVEFRDELPKTISGKIRRVELKG